MQLARFATGIALAACLQGCHQSELVEYTTSPDLPDSRIVTVYYEHEDTPLRRGDPQAQWVERWAPEGMWIRNGEARVWSRDRQTVEKGSYLRGQRDGLWFFWNDDRTIDEARSGVYENGTRVYAGPSQPGDYPVEGLDLRQFELRRLR